MASFDHGQGGMKTRELNEIGGEGSSLWSSGSGVKRPRFQPWLSHEPTLLSRQVPAPLRLSGFSLRRLRQQSYPVHPMRLFLEDEKRKISWRRAVSFPYVYLCIYQL